MMRFLAAVLSLGLFACSAPLPPRAETRVRVTPKSSTISVGQSVPLNASTIDSAGDSVGVATVTWVSSAPSVASVSDHGVVTGLAAGVASIVATASHGQPDTALITVIAGICGGIDHQQKLHGKATFTYTYNATLNSAQYVVNDGATMSFTVDSQGGRINDHMLWFGSATGNGSEQESRTDLQSGQVQTLSGSGSLFVQDINYSHAIVDVDLSACTYTLEAVPYIDVMAAPTVGDLGPSWIGWFRTQSTPLDTVTHSQPLATHSASWLGGNYTNGAVSWYVPLGFSSDYFSDGAPDDGSAGAVSVTYSVARGS